MNYKTIEDRLDREIRLFQAKKMQKENGTYRYSKDVNDILKTPKNHKDIFLVETSYLC